MCTPFDIPANATAGSANNGGGSGEGTFPEVGSTICYDDPNFREYRTKWSALNLIFWQKRVPCNFTEGVCSQCPRAWRASPEFTVRAGPAHNDYPPKTPNPRVILFFKEPVLLTRLRILQLQNPGVTQVDLLGWPATKIPGVKLNVSKTVVESILVDDNTSCGGNLILRRGPRQSGINLPVPENGTQSTLTPDLAKRAIGGLVVYVKQQPVNGEKPPGYTFIPAIRTFGRVLYPKRPGIYDRWLPGGGGTSSTPI